MASSSSQPSINWAELPRELTSSIMIRLGTVEILENAQKVCRSWRRVCKDPSMFRKIDMRNNQALGYDHDWICRYAVYLSEGGLVEINLEHYGNDSLLSYIAQRSSNLTSLGLAMGSPMTNKGLVKAIEKLPLLETLEVSHSSLKLNLIAIGQACPQLKTFKLNSSGYVPSRINGGDDDDYALAIAESMPELRHLQLLGNRLTDIGLNAILDSCPHLEHLDLRKCFYVNLAGNLEKRCLERIKELRRPDDSTADYPHDVFFVNSDLDDDYQDNISSRDVDIELSYDLYDNYSLWD